MSTTSTDPRDIEAELERERASLASTLDALSDRVSVDNLAREALTSIRSHAGSYASSVDHVVRANPLAVALIGAGVAWLALGGRIGAAATRETPATGHPEHDELPRWEGEGGPPPEYGAIAYRPTTSGADDHAWSREAQGLRARASATLRRLESEARAYAGGARDFAAERAQVVSGFASDLKARLSHGLDALPEGSREAVVAARERAYAAALKAERAGRRTLSEPGRMMEDHPLVAGAVAFALGAAVAAALPRTDAEDQAFGGERDRLMDEAARLLRAERDRAVQIAGAVTDEVRAAAGSIVEDVKARAGAVGQDLTATATSAAREALEAAADRAGEAATRVTDRAADEVEGSRPQAPQPSPVIG